MQAERAKVLRMAATLLNGEDAPDGRAGRAGARQAEDDAGAVREDKAQALLGGHAAVDGVLVLKVVRAGQLIVTKLGALLAAVCDALHVLHQLVGSC